MLEIGLTQATNRDVLEKALLKNFAYSKENVCIGVSFLIKLHA